MKTLAIILTAFVATGAYAQHEHHQPTQAQEQSSKQFYTCPMHPEIVRNEPGQCPKCGMTLVPIKEKKKSAPTHAAHNAPETHADHATHNADGMAMAEHHRGDHPQHEMEMHSSINIVDPMNREGSGTSWIPDSSPIYAYMKMFGDDMLMLHGAIFPRYTNVSSDRGDDRIDAPNWIMAMFSHPFGDATQLGLRAMMSLDLLTEQGRGYPLLLQSGESWHDQPL
ncbi:MAG TPA: heavy metal-binding domain-containing protein, partial [Chthoniobacterales bacterium]